MPSRPASTGADQFFTEVMHEIERAVALRAVYTVLREEAGPRGTDPPADARFGDRLVR